MGNDSVALVGVPPVVYQAQGISIPDFIAALDRMPVLVAEAKARIEAHLWGQDLTKVCVGHSGGKDSVLVRWLTTEVGIRNHWSHQVWSIHNVKTTGPNAVHPKTQEFLYACHPEPLAFLAGDPTVHGFKIQIDGTRINEATRDNGRSTDFIRDGVPVSRSELSEFVARGLFGMSFVYPIYDWTDTEVWAAIHRFAIPYSLEYAAV